MDKNVDWDKILRYLSGESTLEEELEFEEWMNSAVVNREFVQFLEMIWQMEPSNKKNIDADSAWKRFEETYSFNEPPAEIAGGKKSEKKSLQKYHRKKGASRAGLIGVAASFLVIIFVALQFSDVLTANEEVVYTEEIEYRELRTEKGQRTRVILSDGSIIHLNGGSYLRIPEAFKAHADRRVYLEGEAYFEISRNEDVRFQVVAGETVTTVLGTRFTVRSYEDDTDVTVVVADGRVSLGYLDGSLFEPAILTENQKGVISNGVAPIISSVANLSIYHGWTTGNLVFEQESVPQMISKLERWFGIEIETPDMDETLSGKKLTATYSERQPVEDVLQSISLVLDLSIVRSDTSSNTYILF